jgi:hypothetical protein
MELSKSIQMFYKNVIESSSDEESDDDSELMMATTKLLHEYFHPTKTIFNAQKFRCRYRMSRKLFLTILNGVRAHDDYFTARPDATGKLGFTSYQKCSAAIHILAYGVAGDLIDGYL